MEHKQTKVAHKSTEAKWNKKFQFQLSEEEKETKELGRMLKMFIKIIHNNTNLL